MGVLSLFTGIREIKKAVVADIRGALLEAAGEPEGEAVAAVLGFAVNMMSQAGETLGLGAVSRMTFSGPNSSCIVTRLDDHVVGVYLDPSTSPTVVEKKLDSALYGKS